MTLYIVRLASLLIALSLATACPPRAKADLFLTELNGFGVGGSAQSLYDVITEQGLTGNLKVALDSGDVASYDGSSQTWTDRSGNIGSAQFVRGTSTSSEASDPTFNGVAGSFSSSEYFSVDGGDSFRYNSTNETWMNRIHQDSAKWSYMAGVFVPSGHGTSSGIFGDDNSDPGDLGMDVLIDSAERQNIRVFNGGVVLNQVSSLTANQNAWNIIGATIDEAAGGTASHHFVNGTFETFNGTYSSPTGSAAGARMEILAAGGGNIRAASGFRIAWIAIWEGTPLSQSNMSAIYSALRARHGL